MSTGKADQNCNRWQDCRIHQAIDRLIGPLQFNLSRVYDRASSPALASSVHPTATGNPMARVRCITEMGMGVDVHGKDATKAAKRAVSDAIRHSSLGFFRMLGKTANDMFVEVTVAVPDPSGVDTAAVAKELPYGTVNVTAVKGGLEVPAESGSDSILIANAAVIVSFDDGKTG